MDSVNIHVFVFVLFSIDFFWRGVVARVINSLEKIVENIL